ncbi:hypothetical protein ACIRH0_04140 [Streptomyces sp. NPDC093675]|uniref:hypothetical protein n=1 Tax=Streptomyces sp. NPDC093675 TaxID=3366049 RepID=UPI0038289836
MPAKKTTAAKAKPASAEGADLEPQTPDTAPEEPDAAATPQEPAAGDGAGDPGGTPDEPPAADPEQADPQSPADDPCRACFPNGWQDSVTAVGCEHGNWQRTHSADD